MRKLRAWLLRFRGLFLKDDRDFADELESHLSLRYTYMDERSYTLPPASRTTPSPRPWRCSGTATRSRRSA